MDCDYPSNYSLIRNGVLDYGHVVLYCLNMGVLVDSALNALLSVAEETLTFDYQIGNVTRVRPHSTGMRKLPSLVVCALDYATRIDSPSHPTVRSRPGDAICLPPGFECNATMTSPGWGISRWSHVSYHILGTVDVFALLQPPLVIRGRSAARIGTINAELAQLNQKSDRSLIDVIRHKALGLELLALVTEKASLVADSLQRLQGARNVAPVLAYITDHLGGELGRTVLAQIAHLSPSRFHTVFEQALGKAPGQYVQDLRVKRAQQLLISSTLGVEEIGAAVGYHDPFHFSRFFKKRVGTSPSVYRQQARTGMT